jgi:hypothetical protein
VRGNAKVKARLAQLLTEPSSPNPRWLVKFDGLSLKDEEVYEHVFAKAPSPTSDQSLSDNYSSSQNRRRQGGYGSDSNSNGRQSTKRALAREARSRNRQAKIDETARQSPPPPPPPPPAKRRIPPPPSRYSKAKKARPNSSNGDDDDGEVVKVKLLTGTLYMYRGIHRRVEFVRRV